MYPIQRSHIHLGEIWDTIQNLLCRKITSHPVTLSHWSLRMTDLFAGIEKGLIQTVRVFVQFEPPKLPPRLLKDRNIAKSIYSASCAIKSVFGRFITITNYSLAWSCTAVVSNTHVSFAADCIVQRKLPQFAWDALAHASSSSSTSHSITNEGKRLQADVVEAWVHNTPAAEKAAKHLKALYEDDENHIILAVASRRWFLQAIIIRIDTARLTAHLAIWRQRRQRPTFPSSTCKKNTTKTTLLLEKQKHTKNKTCFCSLMAHSS